MKSKSTRLTTSSKFFFTLLALGALTTGVQQAQAAARTWNNIGTDFNTATNWTTTTPGVGDVAKFTAAVTAQPNLSASLSISGFFFNGVSTSGYDITNNVGTTFTLTGYSTSGSSGTSDSSAAAIRADNTAGTNTIEAPITLAPTMTGQSTFVQAVGGTLILNGAISSAAGINLSLRGGGTIQLNGANSYATGSIDTASEVVVVGNDSALGAGTFTVGNTATLQAGGGARTIATNIVAAANTTLSGANAFTFNGSLTSSASSTRTLTVSNTGGATFAGNVFLAPDNTTARGLIINGSSNVAISGVVANNNSGNTLASVLTYSGSGTLTLSNANTYSGLTTISGGNVIASHDGAFGTSNVSLVAGAISLTLQGGVTQDYINDSATLSIAMLTTVNLNFTGTDIVNSLVVNGVMEAPGLYNSGNISQFTGTGAILVQAAIPEPSVYILLGVGLLLCGQRFLGRKAS